MEKFIYKYFFTKVEVDVAKECIKYRNKTIPTNEITGFGIQLIQSRQAASRQFGLAGAVVAKVLTKKSTLDFSKGLITNAKLEDLPEKTAMLVLAHKPMGAEPDSNSKALNIPISKTDPECQRMLDTLKNNLPGKYVGMGMQGHLYKALNISMKGVWIAVISVFAVIFGIVAVVAYLAATTNTHL